MDSWKKRLRTVVVWGGIALVIYFGNVQVQTWLGKRALADTGLSPVSLVEALPLAQSGQKLVLADVSALWCGSCRKLDREVFADPEVQALLARDFVFARLEYESDEGKAFVAEHGLRGLPSLMVLDAAGRPLRNLGVTYDPVEFRRRLQDAADQSQIPRGTS